RATPSEQCPPKVFALKGQSNSVSRTPPEGYALCLGAAPTTAARLAIATRKRSALACASRFCEVPSDDGLARIGIEIGAWPKGGRHYRRCCFWWRRRGAGG